MRVLWNGWMHLSTRGFWSVYLVSALSLLLGDIMDGICYNCWEEDNAERARKGEWTPSFAVDMGPNKPCKKHGGED